MLRKLFNERSQTDLQHLDESGRVAAQRCRAVELRVSQAAPGKPLALSWLSSLSTNKLLSAGGKIPLHRSVSADPLRFWALYSSLCKTRR